jgi:septal ring factor EnvC (AmiA/AmiB activator)
MSQDAQRQIESYAAIIKKLEAQLANGEAKLMDLQRLNGFQATTIENFEAQLANGEAKLMDLQRLNESHAATIRKLEAQLANAESKVAEVQPLNVASADNTTLETLFETYGFMEVAREVKMRRLKLQNWRTITKAE